MKKNEEQVNNYNNKYNVQIGILQAFAIVLVVMGHSGISIGSLDWLFHYDSFHIPLFFFISGYLFNYKIEVNKTYDFIKKKFKRLIIPFFTWNIIYGIIAYLLKKNFGFIFFNGEIMQTLFIKPFTDGNCFFGFNDPSWFLLLLFEVEVIYYIFNLLFNKCKKRDEIIFICSFLFSIISVYISQNNILSNKYLILIRIFYILFYFSLGRMYKKKFEKYDKLNNTIYFLLVIFLRMILILFCRGKEPVAYIFNGQFNNNGFLTILLAITGILFYLRLSKILVPSLKDSKLVKNISQNSLNIMMHHLFAFFILKCIFYFISLFSDIILFDLTKFKTNIWYIVYPINSGVFELLYLFIGICIPLLWAKFSKKIKITILNNYKKLFKKGGVRYDKRKQKNIQI